MNFRPMLAMTRLHLVDDYDDGRELLLTLLAAEGLDVEAVDSGEIALARRARTRNAGARYHRLPDGRDGRRRAGASPPKRRAIAQDLRLDGLPHTNDLEGVFNRIILKPADPRELVEFVTRTWREP